MNFELIAKLRELKMGIEGLPATVIPGDKMRLFRLVIDRELGRVKYGVEVWGARTAIGRLPITKAAGLAIDEGRLADVTVEHTVPVGVLYAAFMKAASDQEFQSIVDHYHVALVTKAEDKLIRNSYKKAQSQMPEGWQFGFDCLARYRGVGIELGSVIGARQAIASTD